MDGVISKDFQQHERGAWDQDRYSKYKENVASHQNHVSLICHTVEQLIETCSLTAATDSSLSAAVAMAPSDSGFDPRQRRHLIRAQLVSQLIRV